MTELERVMRIVPSRLPVGQSTLEGDWIVEVDGRQATVRGRTHWPTRAEAVRAGMRELCLREAEAEMLRRREQDGA